MVISDLGKAHGARIEPMFTQCPGGAKGRVCPTSRPCPDPRHIGSGHSWQLRILLHTFLEHVGASEVLLTVPAMGGGVMEKKGLIVKHVTAPPASSDPRGCPASAFSRLPPDSGAAGPCQVLEHPPPGDSRSTRLRPCACLVSKSLSECFASFSTGLF